MIFVEFYFSSIFFLKIRITNRNFFVFGTEQQLRSLYETKKTFISDFRSAMMLGTFVAILAVDFQVFPRRFAKCETFGISLVNKKEKKLFSSPNFFSFSFEDGSRCWGVSYSRVLCPLKNLINRLGFRAYCNQSNHLPHF